MYEAVKNIYESLTAIVRPAKTVYVLPGSDALTGVVGFDEFTSTINTLREEMRALHANSIVLLDELPTNASLYIGKLVLVPAEGENLVHPNKYDEYVAVNDNNYVYWEKIGTAGLSGNVNLGEYVKKTDYATDTTSGIIKGGSNINNAAYVNTKIGYGDLAMHTIFINSANEDCIRTRKAAKYGNGVGVIAPDNMDLALRIALTVEHGNRTALTDDEKTAACNYLGAVKQTANGGNQVYVSQNRNNTTISYSTQAQGNTIACRGTNGELKVGTPTESTHATTKEYVDNAIANSGGSSVTVDSELSNTSTNPVQNKVVKEAIDNVQNGVIAAQNAANEVSQGLYAYRQSNDSEVGLLKSDVNELKQSAGLYLHKVSFSTKTTEDSNTGAYNADVIEIIILNKQSTQLTKDYFLSLSGEMFNTSISKVFYKESNSGVGQSTVADETTRFDVQQTGEYTFEVINLSHNAIGTMNFSTLSFYDRVIDL